MRQFINDRACCNAEKLHVYLKYVLRFILEFFIPEVQNVISPMDT